MLKNNNFKNQLEVYDVEGKKTVFTNIDGCFTCMVDSDLNFVKNDIVEIKGHPEIYKVNRVVNEIPNTPSYEYHKKRKHDEVIDFVPVKSVNMFDLTKESVMKKSFDFGIPFNENIFKENYIFKGISFKYDGRLNKNQIVRMGDDVVTITELIKPKEKGGLTEVVGVPLSRYVMDSIHRVYVGNDEGSYDVLSGYENWGDALLFMSRFNERTGKRSFL